MKILNSGLVEQDTGFEPAPSVWKTDMLAANTNPAQGPSIIEIIIPGSPSAGLLYSARAVPRHSVKVS